MQNKGAIRLFAILLALVSLYQLSFTYFTHKIESDAKKFANGNLDKEFAYLDSLQNETIYNFIWLKKYTYKDCKEKEINYGLDLKGGMNLVLEVKVSDIVKALSEHNQDAAFLKSVKEAEQLEKTTTKDFVTLFGEQYEKNAPNGQLATIFNTIGLKGKVNYDSSNEDVLKVIREESQGSIDNAFDILRTRIDRFGVTQPNIQKLEKSGRILIELPGIKDPRRVRKLLQGTASLEFWETYDNSQLIEALMAADKKYQEVEAAKTANAAVLTTTTSTEASATNELAKELAKTSATKDSASSAQNSLFAVLSPSYQGGPVMGMALVKDTAKVNSIMRSEAFVSALPKDVKFCWTVKPIPAEEMKAYLKPGEKARDIYQLIAIKVSSLDKRAPLEGDVITNATSQTGERGNFEVSMSMSAEGAKTWARLTKNNIKKSIAIVLDGYVYSYPTVQNEITGGNSQITGNFTPEEAKDLANVLKSGKLPAPAQIVSETVVGPSLGQESINAGLLSFIIALLAILAYMLLYYARAGQVANIALFANVFFLFGFMASLGAVLTLPGIAGIILTLAMAVDANVIIYERMREEARLGKAANVVVKDGFKHALSAIIDGHVTTILTGVVLFIFGSGPVQGFATTLIIGLLLSLFTAIFIARLSFEWMIKRNMEITLGYKFSMNILTKANFDFIGKRKIGYYISGALMIIAIVSLVVRGLSMGVDFAGGRTYIVRFDQPVSTTDVRSALAAQLGEAPEVKTFGEDTQVKITTKYMIEDDSKEVDAKIESLIYQGLKGKYKSPISENDFIANEGGKTIGCISSQKVGPVMATSLIYQAFMAVFFGLIIIFIYITIRFRNWQYGLGGVASLFHDSMVVIGLFSLFHGILPFALEIDQAFIAAILTIIGYSIMDSVIIFDRIREYNGLHPKWTLKENVNAAINSTLGRTINTSGTTLVALIVMFIFGGEILRGFIFALLTGVAIGTLSSVFTATPIAYDIIEYMRKKKEKKESK